MRVAGGLSVAALLMLGACGSQPSPGASLSSARTTTTVDVGAQNSLVQEFSDVDYKLDAETEPFLGVYSLNNGAFRAIVNNLSGPSVTLKRVRDNAQILWDFDPKAKQARVSILLPNTSSASPYSDPHACSQVREFLEPILEKIGIPNISDYLGDENLCH